MPLTIRTIHNRTICIGGVGTMFHQDGFPIGIAAKMLKQKGCELSWFHVIKELHYQYASTDRLFAKIRAEIEDAKIDGIEVDMEQIRQFCYADSDTQREMIFRYLWGAPSSEFMADAKKREELWEFVK